MLFLILFLSFFTLPTLSSGPPFEAWKHDYKLCVYQNCTDSCQPPECTDCVQICGTNTTNYKGLIYCLKNDCKMLCPEKINNDAMNIDCEHCKYNCKLQHKNKRTAENVFRWRNWKEECLKTAECKNVCGLPDGSWNSRSCQRCRRVFC